MNDVLAWHMDSFKQLIAARGSLPHALLLRGQRGVGKLIFARALARALLCEAPQPSGIACGGCTACAWLEGGAHPDYRQVEPGSDADESAEETGKKVPTVISVHQIRALAALVNVSSHRGGPKVIVIHPAEALNVNAANALLKSLEEPPPRTHFLLVTHRPHQLLPTIKSRCRQVALRTPTPAEAVQWLAAQGVRDPEVVLADTGGAPLLAFELAQGEYRGARTAFLRALSMRDCDVFTAAESVLNVPVPFVIGWLQRWSYDMALQRAIGHVRYNPDYADAIATATRHARPLALLRFHHEMVKLQPFAQHPLNPKLFVEDMLLSYRGVIAPEVCAA